MTSQIIFSKFFDKLLYAPAISLHGFLLRVGLQLSSDLSVLMHPIRRLVVAIVAKPYHKTVLLGSLTQSMTSAPHMMPFKPLPCVAQETS